MLENGCETGCKAFTGGEIKHHKDCQFYSESLTKMREDQDKSIEEIYEFIRDDSLAITFQSLKQYRKQLLSFMDTTFQIPR